MRGRSDYREVDCRWMGKGKLGAQVADLALTIVPKRTVSSLSDSVDGVIRLKRPDSQAVDLNLKVDTLTS